MISMPTPHPRSLTIRPSASPDPPPIPPDKTNPIACRNRLAPSHIDSPNEPTPRPAVSAPDQTNPIGCLGASPPAPRAKRTQAGETTSRAKTNPTFPNE